MQNVRRMAHDTMTEKQEVCEVCCGIYLSPIVVMSVLQNTNLTLLT